MNEEATAEIHYLWTTQLNFHIPEQKDWPDSPSLLQLPSNQPKKWQEQSEEVKRKEGKCHSLRCTQQTYCSIFFQALATSWEHFHSSGTFSYKFLVTQLVKVQVCLCHIWYVPNICTINASELCIHCVGSYILEQSLTHRKHPLNTCWMNQ